MKESKFIIKRFDKIFLALSVTLLFLFSQSLISQTSAAYKNAADAIRIAQDSKQFLVLLFYDKKTESLKAMETTVNEFRKTTSVKTLFYKVRITDDKEKDIVTKYNINIAPVPLLLVFAPNGAITGGFPQQVKSQELKKCFAISEMDMEIMKPL